MNKINSTYVWITIISGLTVFSAIAIFFLTNNQSGTYTFSSVSEQEEAFTRIIDTIEDIATATEPYNEVSTTEIIEAYPGGTPYVTNQIEVLNQITQGAETYELTKESLYKVIEE